MRKTIRKTIIALIISTDMFFHFQLTEQLDVAVINNTSAPTALLAPPRDPVLSENDRLVFLKALLHVADISNPAKVWTISKKWSDLVLLEFFDQGDREKKESLLPVSMNCDRDTVQQDEMSINFTDFVVAPFFFVLAKILSKMSIPCKHLENNRNVWHDMAISRMTASMQAIQLAAGAGDASPHVSQKVAAAVATPASLAIAAAIAKLEARKEAFSVKLKSVLDQQAPTLGGGATPRPSNSI